MTTRTLTIAVVQMAMTDGVERQRGSTRSRCVREAAVRGARLVLLPELFENLYWCQVQRESFFANAHPLDGAPVPAALLRARAGARGGAAASASSSGAARRTTTAWR